MESNTSEFKEEEKPTKRLELEYLSAFVGDWQTEGRYGSDVDNMHGTESYSFLENEFFLINKWTRSFGSHRHVGMVFLGYDTLKHKFISQSCDNLGYARTYEVFIRKDMIFLNGELERAKIHLSANKQELFIQWEINKKGAWSELCDLRGSRSH
ncbi:MAG TPA: DUF1579 family protein [Bacteriovoracaceae bacterium]|nr:DUF1579 family protein [Bacteriovoracaceae bacterium]